MQEGKSKADPEDDGEDDPEDNEGQEEGSRKPLKTTFELNDTLFAEAELEDTDTVFLWLGVRPFTRPHSNNNSLIRFTIGQCNALLPHPRSDIPPPIQAPNSRNIAQKFCRGSRVLTGATNGDGGQYCSSI